MTDSLRQISSVVFVIKWVMCIYIRIEHIMARPNHPKSCPNDKNWVSPMRCHVRASVLNDLDIFVVSVYRACGGPWRILCFQIEHIMARPNHHKSCPNNKNWVSPMGHHVRASVLSDLDIFVVFVYRACGGPYRILYFRIEHIMARPNHHKSCPNDENWQSCTRWRVRTSV